MNINKRYLFIVVGLLILVGLGLYHDMRSVAGSNDFDTYFMSGKLLRQNSNLYTAKEFSSTMGAYLYLPFFAVLMSPLTFLPFRLAAFSWYIFGFLAAVGSFIIKSCKGC